MNKIITNICLIALMCFTMMTVDAQSGITLHTIGDSTMADYDENTTDKRGWAMMFQQFFNSDVVVNNRAKSGASSKSFYLEAPYWNTVKDQISEGDYVLIQFAHNDEKSDGLDGGTDPNNPINGDDYRGTTAQGTYKDYLRLYIDETRALGATPILATAICRNYFSGSTITRKGQHDLGDDYNVPASDNTYDYSVSMEEVAAEKGVEILDLTELTKELLESYGQQESSTQLFVSSDSTHPNALGATLVARLAAQEMNRQGILAASINTATDLLISPDAVDFGDAYTGQILIQELTITGFDLMPESGTFNLTVPDGFLLSKDRSAIENYSSSISYDYTDGSLVFSKFYVSATQSEEGVKEGILTATNGSITKEVSMEANFIALDENGVDVEVLWEMTEDNEYNLVGPAQPSDQIYSNMETRNYAQPNSNTTWPADSGYSTRNTQRNWLPGGEAWPANEIDENPSRYMEFGVSPSEGTALSITGISMYIGGGGGSGMQCKIVYSTDDFVTIAAVEEYSSMASNTMFFAENIPTKQLEEGETLKVRVYPWYNFSSPATGKYLCLADVKITGKASSNTASISEPLNTNALWIAQDDFITVKNAPANSNIAIYDLTGRKIHSSSNGENMDTYVINSPTTAGIYIGRIESPVGTQTTKFVIK